jgi:hypothetical protein
MSSARAFASQRIAVLPVSDQVACPTRPQSLALSECLQCVASDGLVDQPEVRYVRCRRVPNVALDEGAPAVPPGLEAAESTKVHEIMSSAAPGEPLGSASVAAFASVAHASAVLTDRGLDRVSVISGDGKVVGTLTAFDIVRWITTEGVLERIRAARRSMARGLTPGRSPTY